MPDVGTLRKVVIIVAHSVVGWGYCGALVAIGRRFFSMDTTLVVHAVGAPEMLRCLTNRCTGRHPRLCAPVRVCRVYRGRGRRWPLAVSGVAGEL